MPDYGDSTIYKRNYTNLDNFLSVYTNSTTYYTVCPPANLYSPPNGKKFKEWNSNQDGTGTSKNPGDTITGNSWWYAIWEDLPTSYKVLEDDLIAVADAINALTGNNGQLEWPDDFIKALEPPIQFSIDEVTYYAKSGMSWEEWINSNYNTDNYYITDNTYINKSIRRWVFDSNYYHIIKTDLIIANEEYATHNDPP